MSRSAGGLKVCIIMQARKRLLFHEGVPWLKRSLNYDFDLPMGSYDGAEVCELVDTFLLNNLSQVIYKSIVGLYRDDGVSLKVILVLKLIENENKL